MSGGGSIVEAALSSIGVSREQLVYNVAEQLRKDIKSVKLVPWPSRVEELEEVEELTPQMVQLLYALRVKEGVDLSLSTLSLSHHTVCHKGTHLYCHQYYHHPSWGDLQQGACRLLLQTKHGDQYSNVLLLRDVWTIHIAWTLSGVLSVLMKMLKEN